MFSGNNRVDAHIQVILQHIQDLHMLKPDKIPTQGGAGHIVPPFTEELLAVDNC